MGYATRYKIAKFEGDHDAFRRAFDNVQRRKSIFSYHDVFESGETWSWHEHEAHIEAAMLASGATLLLLHGQGAEQGDIWDKMFMTAAHHGTLGTSEPAIRVIERHYVLAPDVWGDPRAPERSHESRKETG